MGGCDQITYHNVTQNVFNNLRNKLANVGINVPAGN